MGGKGKSMDDLRLEGIRDSLSERSEEQIESLQKSQLTPNSRSV